LDYIALSSDGTVVAIGGRNNDGTGDIVVTFVGVHAAQWWTSVHIDTLEGYMSIMR
jgi:hypothetical protein